MRKFVGNLTVAGCADYSAVRSLCHPEIHTTIQPFLMMSRRTGCSPVLMICLYVMVGFWPRQRCDSGRARDQSESVGSGSVVRLILLLFFE